MDAVKLPKKVRMVCYEIMDGREEALDTLESFADKYPHQSPSLRTRTCGSFYWSRNPSGASGKLPSLMTGV
ncbi:hypothetical protein [Flavonifractor plautii]|uniref:hypothetical protein n=1 Tax=Flavonifractor plautii TaxID=292800 RepID=UPI0019576D74|nr:hypothetical protein [Flavonifractor plautii]MBM6663328.1 hypothetical protein [Flavonifractor plautii]